MDEENTGLPLGLFKQAFMKLEAFSVDLYEILEDPSIPDDKKFQLQGMKEKTVYMLAEIINIIKEECGEDEFLAVEAPMDPIDPWPSSDGDIMESEVE